MELEYEPHGEARHVVVEQFEGKIRIRLPMKWPYAPVPKWAPVHVYVAAWVAVKVVTMVYRIIFRVPSPPRAVFDIDPVHVTMIEQDLDIDQTLTRKWRRDKIVEIRRNRYEKGLWVDVAGAAKETYLREYGPPATTQLEEAIRSAMNKIPQATEAEMRGLE